MVRVDDDRNDHRPEPTADEDWGDDTWGNQQHEAPTADHDWGDDAAWK